MRKTIFLASVRTDLIETQRYIAQESGSRAVARNFVATLRRRCHELAASPGTIGRARPELGSGIRSVSHKGYVIFFRYVGDRFEEVHGLVTQVPPSRVDRFQLREANICLIFQRIAPQSQRRQRGIGMTGNQYIGSAGCG